MALGNQFTIGWANLGSIVWYIVAAGLTTPIFRLVDGEATMGRPTAAAGGLIAAQRSQQWNSKSQVLNQHLN